MYLGKFVEIADTERLYKNVMHPYSQALISAIPSLDPQVKSRRIVLAGDVPSPAAVPSGCPFHPRCPKVMPQCRTEIPVLRELEPRHWVSCWLY
jgi:peptide/nickel transport system ATP-binding protein